MARPLRWMFVSRRSGHVTVVQWPNVPLVGFLVLTVVTHLTHATGHAGDVLSGLAMLALAVWAIDEIGWGVNPFRRLLGAVVLLSTAATLWWS